VRGGRWSTQLVKVDLIVPRRDAVELCRCSRVALDRLDPRLFDVRRAEPSESCVDVNSGDSVPDCAHGMPLTVTL
jgi:hypothetical protein